VTHLVLRRAGVVCFLALLLALAGGYFSFRLYSAMRPGIEELLPASARSVVDFQRLGKRLKTTENLVVLAFSSDVESSKRFVEALAHRLASLPKDLVGGVEYRVDAEIEFFRKHAPLFLEYDDLQKLKDYSEQKIAYEKAAMGLGLGLTEEPVIDFERLTQKYAGLTDWANRFPEGYFATKDQTCRLLIVNLNGRPGDIDAALRLKAAVEKTVVEIHPKSYAPDLEVRYTGNTQNFIEEHAAIIEDVKFTSITVMILVSLSLWFYFQSARSTLALAASATVGTVCTLGASYFFAGPLNANSAFLASIVLGNGVNFGIILLARYREELSRPRQHLRALVIAIKQTYTATLTAALAAGAAYGSLMFTDFRGLNQFGRIGLAGMVVCWVSAFTLLPALLQVLYRRRPLVTSKRESISAPTEYLARFLDRHPRKTAATCFAITLCMAATLLLNKQEVLELDLNRLRDRDSLQSGAGHYFHYISDIFGKNLSATVLLTETRGEAKRLAALLKERQTREGRLSQIAWVQTLDDMVPTEQARKLELLAKLRKTLKPSFISFIPEEHRPFFRALVESEGIGPFFEIDLSPTLLDKFTEKDGRRGNIVLVDKPVVAKGEAENALVTVAFIRSLREAALEVSPNIAAAGYLPLSADLILAIKEAGPKTALIACFAVLIVVTTLFRDLKTVSLVMSSLWVGVLWMIGLILWFDIKINFLNFIALPITFGIGVDYGINIFQRFRQEGNKSLLDAVRHTGGAVAMCSLTTVIGYTSLLMAGNQAFVSFGILAVLGELCCAFTAIVFLPAILRSRFPRQEAATFQFSYPPIKV